MVLNFILLSIVSSKGAFFIAIELALVAYIIMKQRKESKETYNKIQIFRDTIPNNREGMNLTKYNLHTSVLQSKEPKEILERLEFFNINNANSLTDEVALIEPDETNHAPAFRPIRDALNTYLLRNKGGVADFHLIKDVVERHTDAQENEINLSLPTPLYYGLLGTMIGIVLGLLIFVINVGSLENTTGDMSGYSKGINELLFGVCIGMGASAYGLWLTVENSTAFRNSKSLIEKHKNNFYTFVQTEILPILTQNLNTGFHKLELNLQNFNNSFTNNISELKGLMNNNHQAIKNQTEMLELLKEIDISEFAESNVRILSELRGSTKELSQFGKYLERLNEFVSLSTQLNTQVMSLLDRSDNFKDIAENIKSNLDTNTELTRFLRSHYHELDERGQLIKNAVERTDIALSDALVALKNNVEGNSQELAKFSFEEKNRLSEVLASNATNLKNLEFLSKMHKSINDLRNDNNRLESAINNQSNIINKHFETLIELQKQKGTFGKMIDWLKDKFSPYK